ncbi:MAG: threonine ammonia-lyase [Alphaproteobacteria bacterium]
MTVSLATIQKAAQIIAGSVIRTPLVRAQHLQSILGFDVFLKLENLQNIGSFKQRGALVKLKSLSPQEAEAGVIAMSAGNHAQGVAYHAQKLGIPAVIVMPLGTPFGKIEATSRYGARVILDGDSVDAAGQYAREIAKKDGLTFVHPFDDEHIIAGQGTIGLELLEDCPDLDTVIVPIGGGGIIAGIATAIKSLKPNIEIIGIESTLYPSMYCALRGEKAVFGGPTIAEGIALKSAGEIPKEIAARLVDDIFLVDDLAIETAVQILAEKCHIVAEGAGAASLAGALANRSRFTNKKVALIICGGNIDSRILASVLLRGMVREGRMASLRVEISDRPGTLSKVAKVIGDTGGNIVEVIHQRMFYDVPVRSAELDCVVETRNRSHVQEIVNRLREVGFPASILRATQAEEVDKAILL